MLVKICPTQISIQAKEDDMIWVKLRIGQICHYDYEIIYCVGLLISKQ